MANAHVGTILHQGQATEPLMFFMVSSTDHVSAKTGITTTVTLSKNGAAFGAPAGAVAELASGWYKVAANAVDTNTLGPLILHATGSGCDPTDIVFQVVAQDPEDAVRAGMTALPAAAFQAAGGLDTDIVHTGTAQAGAASTITLAAGASAVDNFYRGSLVRIVSGTGAGQTRDLSGYTGSSKLATVSPAWLTTPDNTSVYVITSNYMMAVDTANNVIATLNTADSWKNHNGTAQAGAASTITLVAGASAVDNFYIGNVVRLSSGTGSSQSRTIIAYVGSTKVATVDRAWATNPDNTTGYTILGTQGPALNTSLQPVAASVAGTVGGLAAQAITDVETALTTQGYTTTRAPYLDELGATNVPADVDTLLTGVNAAQIGGVSQTGRDLGASVLISPGTGTGQLDVTAGVIKANLAQILGTALTETAGQIAAGVKKFFNIAVPTSTMNEITLVDTASALTANNDKSGYALAVSQHVIADSIPNATVGGYAAGEDPATLLLVTPANKLATDASNRVTVGSNADKTGYALAASQHVIADSLAGYVAPDNADIATILLRTDVATSTRLATVGYTAPPTAPDIADEVWDEPDADHQGAGSAGLALTNAGAAGVPPTVAQIRAEMDQNSTKLAHLDADVSSRLSTGGYTAPDNVDIATILSDVATILARVDVAVSTRLASGGYTAPDNANILSAAVSAASAAADAATAVARMSATRAALMDNLANLDDAVSTRLASADYVSPDNSDTATILTDVASIKGVTDALPTFPTDPASNSHVDSQVATETNYLGGVIAGTQDSIVAEIDTRLAAADYTAPDNADVQAIRTWVAALSEPVVLNLLSAVGEDGSVKIRRGDSYISGSRNGPLVWPGTVEAWGAYIGFPATMSARSGRRILTAQAVFEDLGEGLAQARVELDSADTAYIPDLAIDEAWSFDIQVSVEPGVDTSPIYGSFTILRDVTPPSEV